VADPLYPKVVVGYEETEQGEDARALAERVVERDGGVLNVVQVEKGSSAEVLRELAEKGEADLIVLGSTHRAALGAVAPGSVAEHLLNGARCRLAIAPKGYARACAGGEVREELRVIGVGFDGTLESQSALEEAAKLGCRAGASIRVIAVDAPAPSQVGPQAAAAALASGRMQERLHEACAELPPEVRALPVYEKGDAAEQLLAHAAEGMDLLVLGSHGFGPLLRLLLGSVAGRVIRNAPCPVLVMPRLSS
jgi:nucleotide-binding universal stress UspA family protein